MGGWEVCWCCRDVPITILIHLLSAVCCLLTIACYQFAPGGAGRDNEGAPVCLGFSGFENNCLAKLISLLWLHTRPCHDTDKSISRIEKTYFNLVSWLRLNGSEWGQHFVLTVATRSLCASYQYLHGHTWWCDRNPDLCFVIMKEFW